MLAELSIRNFAIIDDVTLEFPDGFSVITGETGAGKSILVNALSLLLGGRATSRMVRAGFDSAELSALFFVNPETELFARLEEDGYEPALGLAVRRIVAANDRHRASVNGRPVTASALADIAGSLAGLSGQHAHQGLLKPENHLLYLDRVAGLWEAREKCAALYREAAAAARLISETAAMKERAAAERELAAFQLDEIEKAALCEGEDEELAARRNRMKNARFLHEAVTAAEALLMSGEASAAERLAEAGKLLSAAAGKDAELSPQAEGVNEALFKVEDAARDLARYADNILFDDERLEEVETRLYRISQLKKKYGATIAEIQARASELAERLTRLDTLSEDEEAARIEFSRLEKALSEASRELSEARAAAAGDFSQRVAGGLAALGMEKARFAVELTPLPDSGGAPLSGIESTGRERAAFLLAPNPGEPLAPLKDIASGGELSRVVLALKAILADADAVETVVFDEVDAGIGGAVADAVGAKLRGLAASRQVIVITHLPQIARLASRHFLIAKAEEGGRTVSRVTALSGDDRVSEIARMLAGGNITETSLRHARELLEG